MYSLWYLKFLCCSCSAERAVLFYTINILVILHISLFCKFLIKIIDLRLCMPSAIFYAFLIPNMEGLTTNCTEFVFIILGQFQSQP